MCGDRVEFLRREELLSDKRAQKLLEIAQRDHAPVTDLTCGLPVIPFKLPDDPLKAVRFSVRCMPDLRHQSGCPCPVGSHGEGPRFSGEMFAPGWDESAMSRRSAGVDRRPETDEESSPHSGGFQALANHVFGNAYYTLFRWNITQPGLRWHAETGACEFRHAVQSVSETIELGDGMKIEASANRHGMTVRWGLMVAQPEPWATATGAGKVVLLPRITTRALNLDFEYLSMRLLPGALAEPGRVRNREGWFTGEVFWLAFGTNSKGAFSAHRLWMHPIIRANERFLPVHSGEEAEELPGMLLDGVDALKPPSAATYNDMMAHVFWRNGERWRPTKTYPDLLTFTPERVKIFEVPGMRGDHDCYMDLAAKNRFYRELRDTYAFVDYDPTAVERILTRLGIPV